MLFRSVARVTEERVGRRMEPEACAISPNRRSRSCEPRVFRLDAAAAEWSPKAALSAAVEPASIPIAINVAAMSAAAATADSAVPAAVLLAATPIEAKIADVKSAAKEPTEAENTVNEDAAAAVPINSSGSVPVTARITRIALDSISCDG